MDALGRGSNEGQDGRPVRPDVREEDPGSRVQPGALIEVDGVGHRVLATMHDRVLLIDLRTHHVFLTQDPDAGSVQLPTSEEVRALFEIGRARSIRTRKRRASATARMRAQIDMLDAACVPQGDKAIWIHLAANWTADLHARFGPHDDAWKIRRWRAALRRAEAARSGSSKTEAIGRTAPVRNRSTDAE